MISRVLTVTPFSGSLFDVISMCMLRAPPSDNLLQLCNTTIDTFSSALLKIDGWWWSSSDTCSVRVHAVHNRDSQVRLEVLDLQASCGLFSLTLYDGTDKTARQISRTCCDLLLWSSVVHVVPLHFCLLYCSSCRRFEVTVSRTTNRLLNLVSYVFRSIIITIIFMIIIIILSRSNSCGKYWYANTFVESFVVDSTSCTRTESPELFSLLSILFPRPVPVPLEFPMSIFSLSVLALVPLRVQDKPAEED